MYGLMILFQIKLIQVQPIKILNIIDEYSRECLTSYVARRIRSSDIVFVLADLFLKPMYYGPEFIAKKLASWFKVLGVSPLFITPGSPWENGYCESFNGRMSCELLNGEIFYTVKEARIIITEWVKHYNTVRPHSALGGKPPAPETVKPRLDLVVTSPDFSGHFSTSQFIRLCQKGVSQ
jgi:putative transposase